jgi:2-polyprenyl-3-methyl-5-hydroxy-6-metoxy-1,4-benzoquinol methylase
MDQRCYVCGDLEWVQRDGRLRDAPAIGVFECNGCGLVTHEVPGSLVIDYEAGSMHGDSELSVEEWRAECLTDDSRRFEQLLPLLGGKNAVLDVGCGAGGFLLALEAGGFDAYGIEPQNSARETLASDALSVFKSVEDIPESKRLSIGVVTAFHVLEHVQDPISFVNNLIAVLPNARTFVLEVPCSEDALLVAYQSRAFSNFTYWSHHIHLHSMRSPELLLNGSFQSVEVSRLQRYSLGNHLGWLMDGQPGGQIRFPWLDGPPVDSAYRSQLLTEGYSDSLWAVARVGAPIG